MEAIVYQVDYNDRSLMLDMHVTSGNALKELAEFAALAGKYSKAHVVQVEEDDPEDVFMMTNDGRSNQPYRSTSVGDIILLNGKQHLVASMGFVDVNVALPA